MNCNDFETKITDMVRGQAMDAGARDQAMAHVAECRRCAARWRDEQRLTAGLRQLAATFNEEPAPTHREAQLLAAFRAAHTVAPLPRRARRWSGWAAAAAVIITLMAIAAVRFVEWRTPQPLANNPQAHPQEPSPAPSPGANVPPSPVTNVAPPREPAVTLPHRARPAPRIAPTNKVRNPAADASLATAPGPAANPLANGDDRASEIATSFIPLAEGRGFTAADSLQLVRIELPRAALVSFGLPMNAERADERIKADLLVGNDGVARAIRFVR